jgi:hypothetical protein
MNRINLFRNSPFRTTLFHPRPAILDSIAWGKLNLGTTASPLVFAAILIVGSFAVGCSSQKPKTANSMTQSSNLPAAQPVVNPISTPVMPATQVATKPVHKKTVRRLASTVTFTEKTSGLSFQYPRKYTLKTGDGASELVSPDSGLMNFVKPGGVALAVVTVPEEAYLRSDLASAFFNVSVNKALTAEQCAEFSDPPADTQSHPAKIKIGDMELKSSEVLVSAGNKQEQSKFYHTFRDGACYEFALQVATMADPTDEGARPVNRDEVFQRLEKILATVKINHAPLPSEEAAADTTPQSTPSSAQ